MATDRKIVVERRVKKRLHRNQIEQQLSRCASLALKGPRGQGWTHTIGRKREPREENGEIVYTMTVTFSTTSDRASLLEKWPKIVARFAKAGCAGPLKAAPWRVIEPAGFGVLADNAVAAVLKAEDMKVKAEVPKTLGEMNLVPGDHFKRLYGLDMQTRMLLRTLQVAKATSMTKRIHTVLNGPAGCGKTETMLATAEMLGEEGKAYLWFNAPEMTKAGVLEFLMNADVIPPVVFIEEIEKVEEKELRFLLGLMDTRGHIKRTNYRVGHQGKNVRMIVVATANSMKLLRRALSGSIYSRFQNKVYYPRPSRGIMQQILEREVQEAEGKRVWIEPALKFSYDKWGQTDPREVVKDCLAGGDDLLNDYYQKDREATMRPSEKRSLLLSIKRRKERAAKLAELEKTVLTDTR